MSYTCPTCKQELPEDAFWVSSSSGRRESSCKACRKVANREWRNKNKERYLASRREYDRKTAKERNTRRRARKKNLTPEQAAAEKQRQRESMARTRERRVAEYLAEHGNPPVCECGCGEYVNFTYVGKPNRYVIGHKIDIDKMLDSQYKNNYIPVKRVREALQKIKAERGWTIKELAEHAGVSNSHMKTILYDNTKYRKYGFEAQWVENMFRRLQGMSAPPTTYMLKQFKVVERRYRETSQFM